MRGRTTPSTNAVGRPAATQTPASAPRAPRRRRRRRRRESTPASSIPAPPAAQTAAPTAEAICRGFALCAGSAAGRDSLTASSTGAMPVCTSGWAA